MTDRLSALYEDLLSGSYDCVDRIVLNAYFRMAHNPGGFRVWWRALTGSDETLENTYLMRLAGRFSRRVRGYAKAHGIPVIDRSAGQRKHDLAEEYLANTTVTRGLFLVLVGRAQAPVWDVNAKHHIERKKPMPRPSPGQALCQPLFLPHPRPRLGASDDQDQRASAVPRSSDVERPRIRRLPGTQGGPQLYQGRELLYDYLRRRRLGEDRRHLVRASGYRAIEPGLRALDLQLSMLRTRLRRAKAQRVPLTIFQLSDRI
jgi:hypothetical protein